MLQHLNAWPDKPCVFVLEDFEKTPISMVLQQLAGTPTVKTYIDGTKIIGWPFAILIRVNAHDLISKFDAVEKLMALDEWLESEPLPDLLEGRTAQKIEMTSLPSLAASYDNGAHDYQAIFRMTYKQKRGG